MTYDRLRDELGIIRENSQKRHNILKSIVDLDERKFERLQTVTDTSKDYTVRTRSTDDGIIDAIEKHEKKRLELIHRLEDLPKEDEELRETLWHINGIKGVVMLCYFIQGAPVGNIASWTEYSTPQVYRFIHEATDELFYSMQR